MQNLRLDGRAKEKRNQNKSKHIIYPYHIKIYSTIRTSSAWQKEPVWRRIVQPSRCSMATSAWPKCLSKSVAIGAGKLVAYCTSSTSWDREHWGCYEPGYVWEKKVYQRNWPNLVLRYLHIHLTYQRKIYKNALQFQGSFCMWSRMSSGFSSTMPWSARDPLCASVPTARASQCGKPP